MRGRLSSDLAPGGAFRASCGTAVTSGERFYHPCGSEVNSNLEVKKNWRAAPTLGGTWAWTSTRAPAATWDRLPLPEVASVPTPCPDFRYRKSGREVGLPPRLLLPEVGAPPAPQAAQPRVPPRPGPRPPEPGPQARAGGPAPEPRPERLVGPRGAGPPVLARRGPARPGRRRAPGGRRTRRPAKAADRGRDGQAPPALAARDARARGARSGMDGRIGAGLPEGEIMAVGTGPFTPSGSSCCFAPPPASA
jgi:hypothetical protein